MSIWQFFRQVVHYALKFVSLDMYAYLDMYALNSLCDGVSWFWSGFLSDANLIWLTSIPMGDAF